MNSPPDPEDLQPAARRETRILALDVGEKRIGLAISDPLGITAQGIGVLSRKGREEDLTQLVKMAREYGVTEIVVGLPRHMDGRPGAAVPAILELAGSLGAALGVEVKPWDERLTTVEAERVLVQADMSRRRRRKVVDRLAAVLILQGYLEYRSHQ
jgi:putative holliday junction resolvase